MARSKSPARSPKAVPKKKANQASNTKQASASAFLPLAIGVIFCHMASSVYHESIFKIPGYKFGWFLTLIEYFFYTSFSFAELHFTGQMKELGESDLKLSNAFTKDYLILAVAHCGAHGLTNVALTHVNFATKLIFKSCKILPVMAGGLILLNKHYSSPEYAAAILMTVGLMTFSLADAEAYPDYDIMGLVCCSTSLICEAFVGNLQERALKRSSVATLTFFQNLNCGLVVLVLCIVNGELRDGVDFLVTNEHGKQAAYEIVMFAFLLFAGLKIVLTIVRDYSAVMAVTTTSVRRALTFGLSFFLYPKVFTTTHGIGVTAVIIGVVVMTVIRVRSIGEKRDKSKKRK
jgi:adenosine 3'-phospho 5'-phosphosulfate transporter B3